MAYYDGELLIQNFGKALNEFEGLNVPLSDVAIKIGQAIKNTPTADVVEVKHGEWIEDPECKYGGDYICSICGNYANESSGGLNDILTNYCSNCGANMDAERKEGD